MGNRLANNFQFLEVRRQDPPKKDMDTRTEEFVAAYERACAAPNGAIVEIVTSTEAISPRTTISALREAAGG